MADKIVAGVYLERNGASVMHAEVTTGQPLSPTHYETYEWPTDDIEKAAVTLARIAMSVARIPGLSSVAIACYGPFLSLRRRNDSGRFGMLAPTADPPLVNFNLRRLFQDALKACGNPKAFITVYTDAEACAIGEALARGTAEKEILAFILVTEGVGLGVARGTTPLGSALHSELGMLHVRYSSSDPLRPDKEEHLYAKSLGEMASNKAMRERRDTTLLKSGISDGSLTSEQVEEMFNLRSYYLAQACLACTVILAPHKIVVGADIDEGNFAADRANKFFREFMRERRKKKQPVFDFEELKNRGYISGGTNLEFMDEPFSFRSTGAYGMCKAAADAKYGARDHLESVGK